jgi:hypothetical protein
MIIQISWIEKNLEVLDKYLAKTLELSLTC